MKPTTVALLILMNMVCTIGYFDRASFRGTKAQETTLLANSYKNNEGTGFTKGINLGRKLMDAGTESARVYYFREICCKMTSNSCKKEYGC
ncbi:hypothetical protein BDA96_06G027300 [Sorghum bicolor]|uniref:Uncharacterized protein n=2 Tax=Sorghum bicolor TaxID=4558 RepID=A0A921QRF0_SORBI|nr:hypothetical protein BDA96_06G027300 [Sorghum bicolor]KXG25883.1 hypothetical protein SORBI_3006G025800 [Sorghum bicolor]